MAVTADFVLKQPLTWVNASTGRKETWEKGYKFRGTLMTIKESGLNGSDLIKHWKSSGVELPDDYSPVNVVVYRSGEQGAAGSIAVFVPTFFTDYASERNIETPVPSYKWLYLAAAVGMVYWYVRRKPKGEKKSL